MAKRYSQPQGNARIDWGNPITKGLVGAYLPQGINAVTNAAAVSITAPKTATKQGSGLLFAGGTEVAKYDSYQPGIPFTAVTLLVPNFSSSSATRQGVWVYQATSGSAQNRLRLIWLDATNGFYLDINGGFAYKCKPTFAAGDAIALAYTRAGVTSSNQFYVNGVAATTTQVVDTSNTGLPSPAAPLWLGDDVEFASGKRLNGTIALHLHFSRVLTGAEIKSLSENPWQIFAPAARSIWVPEATSGTVTHDTSGALTGQLGSIAGTAAHVAVHNTNGTPTGQLGSVGGSAARLRAFSSTGALTGQGASIVGSAARAGGTTTHDTTGTPTGQGSAVVGTAAHVAIHGTSGTLVGTSALLAGTAVHNIPHGTSGDLTGPGSVVVGSALNGLASVTKSGVNRLWLIDYYTKEFAAKERLRNPEPAKTKVVAKKRAAEVAAKVEASVAKAEKDLATLTKSMKDVQDAQVFIYNAIQQAKQAPQAEPVDFMAVAKRYEKKMQQEEHELLLLAMVL